VVTPGGDTGTSARRQPGAPHLFCLVALGLLAQALLVSAPALAEPRAAVTTVRPDRPAGQAPAAGRTGRGRVEEASRRASDPGDGGGGEGGEATVVSRGGPGALEAAGEDDFLGDNGLASPFCGAPLSVGELARANCSYSDFTAAPAPTGNYAFDVHIDTGLAHVGNTAAAVVEDLLQWGWMVLVALVRGLLVALEWCYSLNLLSGAVLGEAARALRAAEAALTLPGLALALAVASVVFAYHGLVRRRVAQTLGQALVMLAMMTAGLWASLDPRGTVGAVGDWVDEASVAVVGAFADGTPERPRATLAGDLGAMFGDVVSGPWCYLEFGNVGWCREAPAADPGLRRAALRIAGQVRSQARGGAATGSEHRTLLADAALIEGARSNGAQFLALPANGAARNSINDTGSLLSALCGGSAEATSCLGPTSAEAEFRTEHGVAARVIGLALIWLGALGMLALFGWIALRLVGAAVMALVLLLMAPVAVLAPALGDGGRGLFRAWALRLLAATTAKLVYSALLGVALFLMNALTGLTALGWWMQWALLSATWWIAILRRRELLGLVRLGESAPWLPRRPAAAGGLLGRVPRRATDRAVDHALHGARRLLHERLSPPPPGERAGVRFRWGLRPPGEAGSARRGPRPSEGDGYGGNREQVEDSLRGDYRRARQRLEAEGASDTELGALRLRLARVREAHREAVGHRRRHAEGGNHDAAGRAERRAVSLGQRAARLAGEITERENDLGDARRTVARLRPTASARPERLPESRVRERAAMLDEQMTLPDSRTARPGDRRRDYRRLATLVGMSGRDWDAQDSEQRREAVLAIDRALHERRRGEPAGGGVAAVPPPGRAERAARAAQATRRGGPAPSAGEPPATGSTGAGGPPSLLRDWLQAERRRAASAETPETLAERARRARGRAPEPDPRERRRRQLRRHWPPDE